MTANDTSDLQDLLDHIQEKAEAQDTMPLGDLLDAVGRRSYGPLLLLVGLIAVSPLSGIPGVPSTIGVLVALISVQLLLRKEGFWLPRWITRRKLPRNKLLKALRWLRPPARAIDRVVRPRWVPLTGGVATYAVAALCLLIALTMPPLELLPFAATLAGAALAVFGLALVGRDGVLVVVATSFTGFIAWFAVAQLG